MRRRSAIKVPRNARARLRARPLSSEPISPTLTLPRLLRTLARSRLAARAALLAPWLAMTVLAAGLLRHGADVVRRDIDVRAHTEAIALAQVLAGRLNTQYRELQFAGVALLGPHGDPRHPDANTVRALHDFAALHPNLYAFNVQSADGNSIVWSTHPQSARPITGAAGFTPLPAQADFLLGRERLAARALQAPAGSAQAWSSGHVMTMRVRVRGADGATRFFVGAPYRVEDLLHTDALRGTPWRLRVVDLRNGSTLGEIDAHGVDFRRRGSAARVAAGAAVAVPGYPLEVRASAPASYVAAQQRAALTPLAGWMAALLAVLGASSAFVGLLLRRLAARNAALDRASTLLARFGELQALLAQVNQSAARLDDEAAFLDRLCRLAVDEGRLALAFVGRPRADDTLDFVAAAGQTRYLDGLLISISPERAEGRGPAGCAWRDGRAYFNASFASAPLTPWRERAARFGLQASAALPIRREGASWAVLILCRGDDVAFDPPMQRLLLELADDVGHGLERIAHRQRLRLLDTAVGALSDGLTIADAERRLIFVNAAFASITGYRPAEVLGRSPALLQGPDSDAGVIARIGQALRDGTRFDGELLNRRRDGTPFWNHLHIDPVRDAQGRVTHYIGIQHDASREREALDLQQALLANAQSGILIARRRTIVTTNSTMAAMLGRTPDALTGSDGRLLYPDEAEYQRVGTVYAMLQAQGWAALPGVRLQRADGSTLLCDLHGRLLSDHDTSVWTFIDVGEREAQAQRLQRAQRVYRALLAAADALLQSTSDAAMIERLCASLVDGTDFSATWLARPDAQGVFATLGRASVAHAGLDFLDTLRVSVDDPRALVARAWREGATAIHLDHLAVHEGAAHAAALRQLQWVAALATPVPRAGQPWGVLVFTSDDAASFDDITRAACEQVAALLGHGLDEVDRKTALQTLQDAESQRARTDALTGLPNRRALDEYLSGALARAERRQSVLAVGLLDLDDFKPVNDAYGHAAGDTLLRAFAQALHARMRRGDFLARIGGDEFVVVFENLDRERHLDELGVALERLHDAVRDPFELGAAQRAQIGMTMGLACFPVDAREPDALLRLADAAMYANKLHKLDRARWWRIGTAAEPVDDGMREAAFDLFGTDAAALLGSLDAQPLDELAAALAAALADSSRASGEPFAMLGALSADERAGAMRAQAEHLREVLGAHATRDALLARARALGQAHALAGVSAAAIEEAYGVYEDLLRERLENALISSRQRYRVLRVATGRMRLDLQTQLVAIGQTSARYFALLEHGAGSGLRWVDLLPAMLQALGELPGVRHAIVFRPDAHGALRDEAGVGTDFGTIAARLRDEHLYLNLDLAPDGQREPVALAWFTRQVQVVGAFVRDARLARWHALAQAAGWRSAACVPIASGDDTDSVLVLFGAYPQQFSSDWMHSWLELLRNGIGAQFAATAHGLRPLAPERRRALRELLHDHGLRMWVQPIVDLHSGAVRKVEALARLHTPDGEVLTPAQFLPAFGEQDLHTLFLQGLAQALEMVHGWRDAGLDIEVAVNLPPSTLAHPDCASWIEQALRRAQVAARHLVVEVLENETIDRARSDEAIYALGALGVRLALDDLGAGYNSLTRLAALPIDTVKIDQSLLHELTSDPVKTVRLLATLIRLGQQFALRTVVEGLETDGHIEAARMLGAQLGQGYALARPMPAADFPAWLQARAQRTPAATDTPRSWLGALTYQWVAARDPLRQHPLGPLEDCPLSRFLRARSIDDAQVLGWHACVHGDAPAPQRDDAAEALLQWLARRVVADGPA